MKKKLPNIYKGIVKNTNQNQAFFIILEKNVNFILKTL